MVRLFYSKRRAELEARREKLLEQSERLRGQLGDDLSLFRSIAKVLDRVFETVERAGDFVRRHPILLSFFFGLFIGLKPRRLLYLTRRATTLAAFLVSFGQIIRPFFNELSKAFSEPAPSASRRKAGAAAVLRCIAQVLLRRLSR